MNSYLRKLHASFLQHGHPLFPVYMERIIRVYAHSSGLEFNAVRNESRDFIENPNLIVGHLSQLRRFVDSIAVSTAVCERGFSTMNDACSSTCTRFVGKTHFLTHVYQTGRSSDTVVEAGEIRQLLAFDKAFNSVHGEKRT